MFLYPQSQESSCDSLRVPHYDNKTIPKERGAPPRHRGGSETVRSRRDFFSESESARGKAVWWVLPVRYDYCLIFAQAFWYSSNESTSIQPLKIGTAWIRWPRSISSWSMSVNEALPKLPAS